VILVFWWSLLSVGGLVVARWSQST